MSPQQTIAHYRVISKLGEGGMGEVWRAADTKLGREVAIKILPEAVAHDPDRLARFAREAQVLAALNHPNIAAIYGVEERALVMELVPGSTLAERIAQGRIPVEEALAIARQIAEALEYAHERGIVHRDLKPANIKITPEGRVKVLDFGLAKAMAADTTAGDPVSSPTLTMRATMAGTILGTAAYMSPEQARGQNVDKRADIWAFGVVLYEMLAGRPLFGGPTISDTLAAVLKTEPDWAALPAETPASIRTLLRRCLERECKRRLRDIGDAFLAEVEEAPAPTVPAAAPRRRPYWWMAAAGLLAIALAVLALAHFREPAQPAFQLSILPPEKAGFAQLQAQSGGNALSPDGRTLAFVATQDGRPALWVRRLDSGSARPLPGTENAYYPFWSPDSRFLGFFADHRLKKIEVAGGPPQVVCDVIAVGRGGTWNAEGTIVFTGIDRLLYRVSSAGGQPVKLSAVDPAYDEFTHYWPDFLPDGKHFIYLARSRTTEKSSICVKSVDDRPGSGKRIELVKAAANARYVPDPEGRGGWLLFVRDTTLFAQRFDAGKLKLKGDAVPVAEHIGYVSNVELADFSVSQTGVLVYGRDTNQSGRLVWTTRDGKPSPAVAEPGAYNSPRLAPDATRLAVTTIEPQSGNLDVWQIDLAHAITTRFTFDPSPDTNPVWSPDGKQIVFSSGRTATGKLFLKPASGTGNEEQLPSNSKATEVPYDWSRDGRYILYMETGGGTGGDLLILPMTGERKPVPFLQTQFNELQGQFSPDGRWVAYTSDESGRFEIYVRSFTGTPGKFQISNAGGSQPRWRGDGKEIYYLAPDGKMMAAVVKASGEGFERETPRALFETRWLPGNVFSYTYDVTPDGQRFLGISMDASASQPLTLLTNWPARLRN